MDTKKLKNLAISENGFVFDPETGYSYHVNQTGLFVLKQLQVGMAKNALIDAIVEEFEVTHDHAQSDLDHYLSMLNSMSILEAIDGSIS